MHYVSSFGSAKAQVPIHSVPVLQHCSHINFRKTLADIYQENMLQALSAFLTVYHIEAI
jgi:hypothetical protein